VLNTFEKREFARWFQTVTPAFPINLLKKVDFDPTQFNSDVSVSSHSIDYYPR
jgi:hypothetical protein